MHDGCLTWNKLHFKITATLAAVIFSITNEVVIATYLSFFSTCQNFIGWLHRLMRYEHSFTMLYTEATKNNCDGEVISFFILSGHFRPDL